MRWNMKTKITKYVLYPLALLILVASSLMAGCSGGSGVEAGNPDISAKKITITPTSGTESYEVTVLDEDTVVVSQLESGEYVETTTVTYSEDGNTITFEVTFSDGTTIEVTLTFDDDGNLESGTLEENSSSTPATFEESAGENHEGTTAEALTAGFSAFEERDTTTAESEYCEELLDDPTNSTLAFGCFWSKMMLIPETTEATTLLAAFDENPFSLETSLFGTNGLFDNIDDIETEGQYFILFNYLDFNLPFADFFTSVDSLDFSEKMASLLDLAIDNGISTSEIQNMIDDLTPYFTELEALLTIVLADADFTFTLPPSLYRLDEFPFITEVDDGELDVIYTDVELFMGSLQSIIVNFEWSMAYDLGVEIENIVQSGNINQAILVADLNGTGETIGSVTVDTIPFLTLTDSDRITNSQSRLLSALTFQKNNLQNILDGEVSDFATEPSNNYDLSRYITFLEQMIDSINNGLTDIDLPGSSLGTDLQINMQNFFSSPPDASTLDASAGDPFVLESGDATLVESYFRELLDGTAEF